MNDVITKIEADEISRRLAQLTSQISEKDSELEAIISQYKAIYEAKKKPFARRIEWYQNQLKSFAQNELAADRKDSGNINLPYCTLKTRKGSESIEVDPEFLGCLSDEERSGFIDKGIVKEIPAEYRVDKRRLKAVYQNGSFPEPMRSLVTITRSEPSFTVSVLDCKAMLERGQLCEIEEPEELDILTEQEG